MEQKVFDGGAPAPRPGLTAMALAAMLYAHGAVAEDDVVVFNDAFLRQSDGQQHVDLSIFSNGNVAAAGTYPVDVILNKQPLGQQDVEFHAVEGKRNAQACLSKSMLRDWGVKIDAFPALVALDDDACVDLATMIPDSTVAYDPGSFVLAVSVPQAAVNRIARNSVNPDRWNQGINAAILNYQISGSQSNSTSQAYSGSQNTLFGGLRGGFNLGEWRFRHYSSYYRDARGGTQWQPINTFMQRDIVPWRSQLTIGDGNTPGDIFEGVQFRGAQLASDDSMLPYSLQGYAPTVRGTALSSAEVSIRQNGYLIYSTYVPPGPFVIDDLYASSGSGDLEVTIREADGRETKFIQPFAALPVMLREGAWRYSATAGKYRSGYGDTADPFFVQATATRGLPGGLTLYGGLNMAEIYQAALVGLGYNMGDIGAVSFDVSHARSKGNRLGTDAQGSSLGFRYAKSFTETGTNLQVFGYRYSTRGYRTFAEAARMYALVPGESLYNKRSLIQGSLSQTIPNLGTVFLSVSQISYWGADSKDNLVRASYNTNYKRLQIGLALDITKSRYRPSNTQVSANLSIPLGRTASYAGYSISHDNEGRLAQQASLSGSMLEDNRLSYNINAARDSALRGARGYGSVDYMGSLGTVRASHVQGSGYRQTTLGVSGGMVLHGGRLTLSQPLGETIAVVSVPGAAGVNVPNSRGVKTDWSGHAIVPNVAPYRVNRIALRATDLGDDIEVKNAAQEIVPTRGAVVKATFDTRVGHRVLFELTQPDGKPLPFGALIADQAGTEVGVVGPDGQAFVTGLPDAGRLSVKWSNDDDKICSFPYRIDSDTKAGQAFGQIRATCTPGA